MEPDFDNHASSGNSSKPLKLNEIHSDLISEYLRFCKYQLGQRLKSIDYCFTTLLNLRVISAETYTGDEVKEILTDLQDVVRGEVDSELTDGVHTNALFVQQLLQQAEEWHLTLSANISELENREKLNSIKMFDNNDQEQQRSNKMKITVEKIRQVIPVEDMNVASALKREITRLTGDNDFLKAKLEEFEKKREESSDSLTLSSVLQQQSETISKLESDLTQAQSEIHRLKGTLHSLEVEDKTESFEKLRVVQDAVDTLSKELETNKIRADEETEKLRKDLEERESKLRQIQSNLLLAEKELDKKFQATSAYVNMKKILLQKNNIIKGLRKKLDSLGVEGEGEEENDDDDKDVVGEVTGNNEDNAEKRVEEEGFRI